MAVLACAHAQPKAPPGFGTSKERPVEVCLPPGEKAYLDQVRCADGPVSKPRRLGNVGMRTQPLNDDDPRILLEMDPERPVPPGEPDFHMIEAIDVRCGGASYTLFFDMYHCPAAQQPVVSLQSSVPSRQ